MAAKINPNNIDSSINTGYLHHPLNPEYAPIIAREIKNFLKRRCHTFDGIAVRGMSGMLIGPTVAMHMRRPLNIIRKPMENSHSYRSVEGSEKNRRYVIIDDTIVTGVTIDSIVSAMRAFNKGTLVGIVIYNSYYTNDDVAIRHNCWIKTVGVSDLFYKP